MGKDKNEQANHVKRKVQVGRKWQQSVDWEAVDGELLKKAIAATALDGGALRFGYTRDGGAYAVGVLGDGDPYTLYAATEDEIAELLQAIIEGFKM